VNYRVKLEVVYLRENGGCTWFNEWWVLEDDTWGEPSSKWLCMEMLERAHLKSLTSK
jgi:hypothetical protein